YMKLLSSVLFLCLYARHRAILSFPTRRSSDLVASATKHLKRLVSSTPAMPTTMWWGSPETFWSAETIASRGLATLITKAFGVCRSEEHTSELQSREKFVCRLLREKQYIHPAQS